MKAERKFYYKVTAKKDKQHVSVVDIPKARRVVYRSRRWTGPASGCGPLCVFNTFQAAANYRYTCCYLGSTRIWRCEIHPSEEKTVWDATTSLCLNLLPAGTVLADKVRLVKQERCYGDGS